MSSAPPRTTVDRLSRRGWLGLAASSLVGCAAGVQRGDTVTVEIEPAAQPRADDAVRVDFSAPRITVGERRTEIFHLRREKLRMGSEVGTFELEARYDVEVLALMVDIVTIARVQYTKLRETIDTPSTPGSVRDAPFADGRTLMMAATGQGFDLADEGERAAKSTLGPLFFHVERGGFGLSKNERSLPIEALVIGRNYAVFAKALARVRVPPSAGSEQDCRADRDDGTAILTTIEDGIATFAVRLRIERQTESWRLQGTMSVGVLDGRVRTNQLHGTIVDATDPSSEPARYLYEGTTLFR